jgi:enolase
MNIINGGSHSDAPIAFQEFMIMPVKATSFTNNANGNRNFHHLKKFCTIASLSTAVGDEGGLQIYLAEDALNTIKSRRNAGYTFGDEVKIALDCAAAEFYVDGKYDYKNLKEKRKIRSSKSKQIILLN